MAHATPQDSSTQVRPPRKTGYLPSLDGWRAIAVLGVMLTHDKRWNSLGPWFHDHQGYGGYGVYLFFAISGFLITSRILEEEAICGRFDIRRFYIRRVFRIQPAAWAYLAAVAVLIVVGLNHQYGVLETWRTWTSALLLYTNYTFRTNEIPSLSGHFWTLAVEEHFYILLSLTLLVVKRRRALALGTLLAGLSLITFIGEHRHWTDLAPRSTQWNLTSLLLAALVAVLVRRPEIAKAVRWALRPWVAFVATAVLMVAREDLSRLHKHLPLALFSGLIGQVDFAATYLLILWVVATVFHPRSLTTRLLETRGFRFVGRISYSLYLWHVLVFYAWNFLGSTGPGPIENIHNAVLRFLAERPARYATAFVVAILCYQWIEKPLIRMGHRLAPPATPGRPELADLPVETPLTTTQGNETVAATGS